MYHSVEEFREALSCGDIYYFHGNVDTPQPHYQMVINTNPSGVVEFVFLSVATTNIEGREKYVQFTSQAKETFVIIEPGQIKCLSKRCCFDCNSLISHNIHDLYWHHLQGKFHYKERAPENIVKKILEWIRLSDDVSPRDKKIIFDEI